MVDTSTTNRSPSARSSTTVLSSAKSLQPKSSHEASSVSTSNAWVGMPYFVLGSSASRTEPDTMRSPFGPRNRVGSGPL